MRDMAKKRAYDRQRMARLRQEAACVPRVANKHDTTTTPPASRTLYNQGCRCRGCTVANNLYYAWWYHKREMDKLLAGA